MLKFIVRLARDKTIKKILWFVDEILKLQWSPPYNKLHKILPQGVAQ
jgi:hypothetical protein